MSTLMTTAQERLMQCEPETCPMCGEDHGRYDRTHAPVYDEDRIHRAAHCCLWKSYDHPARVRIAERVESGANWADAIEGEAK